MAQRDRPHILIQGAAAVEPYRPPPRVFEGRPLPSPRNRSGHASGLQSQLESASAQGVARRSDGEPLIPDSVRGIYVTFRSFPGIELAFERLDPRQGRVHPELRSVREVVVDDQTVEEATVFIPDGKLGTHVHSAVSSTSSGSDRTSCSSRV